MRDEYYQRVIAGLSDPLNADLFEHCACDLLRTAYPTLVPIQGGSDAGMDGAIADGLGEPYPLVCTTGENVLANLTRSLKSYLGNGGQRRKAVLVTSRHLTPQRKRNLFRRANELGFQLINIHDQVAVADLLYQNPRWCNELLGVTGNPPALSSVPLSHRPLLNQTLVGRHEDLEWLKASTDDRLLVGQPGSGKTFLLRKLAEEGRGLFVVEEDRGALAVAIRAQRPKMLMVDDAHTRPGVIPALRQMRTEMGAQFSILASCWPGERCAIADNLCVSPSDVRELEPLDRDQIVEVVREVGIGGPDRLIQEIVDQADGRPGLAVTLSDLCLRGGVRDVALGDALSGSLVGFFESVTGSGTRIILAAFSLGGQSGMPVKAVADATGMNLVDLGAAIGKLVAGGVVFEVRSQCLSVRPPALRHALVRDVLFSDAATLPVCDLLAKAERQIDSVLELIAARARGAKVPDDLLIPLLEVVGTVLGWEAYASLGRHESEWVLSRYPSLATAIAYPALRHAPETEIPLLLQAAVGDARAIHATPEHPLRALQDWVKETHPDSPEVIGRRRVLWKGVRNWLLAGGEQGVGFVALRAVLTPELERLSPDPGKGLRVTILFGGLSISNIAEVQQLWPAIMAVLEKLNVVEWKELCGILEDWLFLGRINGHLSDDVHLMTKSFGSRMLTDITRIALGHPGVLHRLSALARGVELDLHVPFDPSFEILYPPDEREDWQAAAERQAGDARQLALSWSSLSPADAITRIARIEEEARLADVRWPRWTPFLCEEIAKTASYPYSWVQASMSSRLTPDLVEPFLRASAARNEAKWPELARACLLDPQFRPAAVDLLLTLEGPSADLLILAMSHLEGFSLAIGTMCLRCQVPPETLKLLLRHSDPSIAGAAALSTWHSRHRVPISESLREDWCSAIVRTTDDGYLLAQLLLHEPELARRWLEARLREDTLPSHRGDSAFDVAIAAIDKEQKGRLLAELRTEFGFGLVVVGRLVGDDLDLYRQLLEDQRLRSFHLVPLAGEPDQNWIQKARFALDAGYRAGDIASAAVWGSSGMFSFSGSEAATWSQWLERFERLCEDEDADIRAVGEAGKTQVTARRDIALKRERREAVYGID